MDLNELDAYDYEFPDELIAQAPASPRDAAKLLIYDRKTGGTQFDTFKNLVKYLPPKSLLVMNETKVIPARLTLTKESGGRVRALYIATQGKQLEFLADRRLTPGQKLTLSKNISFTVAAVLPKGYLLEPSFPASKVFQILEKYGETPLPPYIKHTPLKGAKLKREYQAVFAKSQGSVAAPTASLHFTKSLLARLRRAGHDMSPSSLFT